MAGTVVHAEEADEAVSQRFQVIRRRVNRRRPVRVRDEFGTRSDEETFGQLVLSKKPEGQSGGSCDKADRVTVSFLWFSGVI